MKFIDSNLASNLNELDDLIDYYKKSGTIPSKITVTAKASHIGYVNLNNYYYSEDGAKNAVKTFTRPYSKPVLVNHDSYIDPIGRVIKSWVEPLPKPRRGNYPKSVVMTQFEITDQDAIQKIMDKRYLTLSIRAGASDVKCSICGNDPFGDSCNHYRGEVYDGKPCYWIINKYNYKELSFVNIPSDQYAQVDNIEVSDKVDEDEAIFTIDSWDPGTDEILDTVNPSNIRKNEYIIRTPEKQGKISVYDNKTKMEDKMDGTNFKELYDEAKNLYNDAKDMIASLKNEKEELESKLSDSEKKYNESSKKIKDLEDEIQEMKEDKEKEKEQVDNVVKKAKTYIIDKIVDLKKDMNIETTDEEKKSYEDLTMEALDALISEFEALVTAKALTDNDEDDKDKDEEEHITIATK